MQTSPLHQALRESTRAAHESIESNAVLKRLLATDLKKDEYGAILSRYYGFFRPLEEALTAHADWSSLVQNFAARLKAPRLRADLSALGFNTEEIAGLPSCERLPLVDSLARFMGVMYVGEGSSLGGRLIAKHLSRLEFISPGNSTFFDSDTERVGTNWKSFLETLGNVDADDASLAQATDSANETFSFLDRWMRGAFSSS